MTVQGIPELKAALEKLKTDVEAASERAVNDEGTETRDDERRLAPELTGELRDGIAVRKSRSKKGPRVTVGIWDSDLWWAIYIEWGRQSAPAQPFATPASELARRRFPERLVSEVRKVLP